MSEKIQRKEMADWGFKAIIGVVQFIALYLFSGASDTLKNLETQISDLNTSMAVTLQASQNRDSKINDHEVRIRKLEREIPLFGRGVNSCKTK